MRDFALEVYFSKWEFAAKYNLNAGYFGIQPFAAAPKVTESAPALVFPN